MSQPLPIAEQIAEVILTLADREREFPLLIEQKRTSPALAGRRQECMDAVLLTLRWLQRNETQIKQALKGREP